MAHPLELAQQAMNDVFEESPHITEKKAVVRYQDDERAPLFELTLVWEDSLRAFALILASPSISFAERDGLGPFFSTLSVEVGALLDRFDADTDKGEFKVHFPSELALQKRIAMPAYQGHFTLPLEYSEGAVVERLRADCNRAIRAGRITTPLFYRLGQKMSLPGREEYHRLLSVGLGITVLRETNSHGTPYDIYLRNSLYYQQGDALRLN